MQLRFRDSPKDGLGWSFVVPRTDIKHSGQHKSEAMENRCPFVDMVKKHIEGIVSVCINHTMDKYNLRKNGQIREVINKVYAILLGRNEMPSLADIGLESDPDGIRVTVYLGKTYAAAPEWVPGSAHNVMISSKFKENGEYYVRQLIEDIRDGKEKVVLE
jgi:hypothetical protein